MLKYRIISAMVLIPIVITLLFLLHPVEFAIFTLVVCMLAAWEWGKIRGFSLLYQLLWLVIICSILLIFILIKLQADILNIKYQKHLPLVAELLWVSLGWWIIALLLVFFYPYSAVLWRTSKIFSFIFGLLTIVPFFLGILALRTWHYNDNKYSGALWLLYITILVWSADSGAYIFGKLKLFGTHKFFPKVSPGKTWQGFIGGLLTATIISYTYGVFLVKFDVTSSTSKLFICSAIAEFASVIGDLTESMFKREAGIKDSGYLIPGHGGILDRIDSLTAAVPVFACLFL